MQAIGNSSMFTDTLKDWKVDWERKITHKLSIWWHLIQSSWLSDQFSEPRIMYMFM